MLKLKEYAKIPKYRNVIPADRETFMGRDFEPEEILQLKELNHQELTGLMVFCGIRTFNDVPLIVLDEDEMRMAYLVWRSSLLKEKKEALAPKMERGIKWVELVKQAMWVLAR